MISGLLALQLAFSQPLQQPPRWLLAAAVTTATPAALEDGLSLGVVGDVQRQVARRAFLSARFGWTSASSANRTWVIDHDQFVAAVGGGLAATRGAGRVWAQLGAGAIGLYERLGSNPAVAPRESSFGLGPHAFGELGVALTLRGGWRGLVAGGPNVGLLKVNDQARVRLGAAVRVGVAYGF
jgi:hypothetical protein